MSDFRVNTIIFNAFINTTVPLIPMVLIPWLNKIDINYFIFIPYSFNIIELVIVILYIKYKKIKYTNTWLKKPYVPSFKLIILAFSINLIGIFILYIYLIRFYIMINKTINIALAAFQIVLLYISGVYIYNKNKKKNICIKSLDNNFKFGILINRNNNSKGKYGMKKEKIVKIMKTLPTGYIVKDSFGDEYMVDKSDIQEIFGRS